MMYIDFVAGDKTYKLRMNTRSVVALERQLGCNPLAIFGDEGNSIPTVEVMVAILHASLQQYNHGVSINDAYDIFDNWLEEGHDTVEFINIILEIYKASGIVPKDIENQQEVNTIEKN